MKFLFLLKLYLKNTLQALFIVISLMNYILAIYQDYTRLYIEENFSSHSIDQAINNLPETGCNKVALKVLGESFKDKFYSSEFSLKKPGNYTKILLIISESISESNSRNSSFFISESTTST